LLCTVAKACAAGGKQIAHLSDVYTRTIRIAEHVLVQLLPQQAAPQAAAIAPAASTDCSSSGSGNNSSSSHVSGSAAAAMEHQDIASPFSAEAVMSWLSLLGRCFLQACQHMFSSLQQIAAQPAGESRQQPDLKQLGYEMYSICDLGGLVLPKCIARVAVLLAAAAGDPLQLPPQQKPVQHEDAGDTAFEETRYDAVDEALDASGHDHQLLQRVWQQLAGHCSRLGLDLVALQQSTGALADAAAAAAPVLYRGILWNARALDVLSSGRATVLNSTTAPPLLLDYGLTVGQVCRSVDTSNYPRSIPEATAVAFGLSHLVQAFMQQLEATGWSLSTLPAAAACNNPSCTSLLGGK
jgi:hypothetical protein